MSDQNTTEESTEKSTKPIRTDWVIRMAPLKIPCPGGCGEMIVEGLTHRPWACAIAKAGHTGDIPSRLDGVTWCSTHKRLNYDLYSRCHNHVDNPEDTCVLHELFYFGPKQ